jgi:hypothetical protein
MAIENTIVNKPTTTTVSANKSVVTTGTKSVVKLTPEEYDRREKERKAKEEKELQALLDSGQFDDILASLDNEPKKNDPERLKRLRFEKDNIIKRYTSEKIDAIKDFRESYVKLVEENDKYKKLGDERMEAKDEKEIENIFAKMMDKQSKNSKFESEMSDMHSRMTKIDNIENKLVDIIPRVSKIDVIEKGMADIGPKISRIDTIEKGMLDIGPRVSKIDIIEKGLKDIGPQIAKIDSICEDGRCFKNDLIEIKKDLAETKKGRIKAEICPTCGEPAVMHSETFLASHCANCGNETEGWTNDDGTPISGWKHYKLRGNK